MALWDKSKPWRHWVQRTGQALFGFFSINVCSIGLVASRDDRFGWSEKNALGSIWSQISGEVFPRRGKRPIGARIFEFSPRQLDSPWIYHIIRASFSFCAPHGGHASKESKVIPSRIRSTLETYDDQTSEPIFWRNGWIGYQFTER